MFLPVYPLPEEDVKLIADSDFDVVLPYAELDRAQLDLLHKYQLKVIYNLKDTLLPKKDRKEDPIDLFHKTLLSVKGHPAIVCWYINDEAPVSMIPLLTRARTLAEQLDPGLPTYSCLLNLAGLRQYLDSLDIVGTDPYPVPEKPLEMVREWTAKTRHACFGSRCTIMALQAFNWGYHWQKYGRTAAEIASARAPSFDEMNAMAWMSIAEGANGLLFYSFMDLKRMDNPPEGFKREDFTPRWNDLKRVASGIRKVEDVLLSAEPPPVLQAQSVSRHVAWRTFSLHGKKWLLVVNCSDTASGTAIFTEIDGKRLELTLKPMEVHFAAY
jgi:hypothetical protein